MGGRGKTDLRAMQVYCRKQRVKSSTGLWHVWTKNKNQADCFLGPSWLFLNTTSQTMQTVSRTDPKMASSHHFFCVHKKAHFSGALFLCLCSSNSLQSHPTEASCAQHRRWSVDWLNRLIGWLDWMIGWIGWLDLPPVVVPPFNLIYSQPNQNFFFFN